MDWFKIIQTKQLETLAEVSSVLGVDLKLRNLTGVARCPTLGEVIKVKFSARYHEQFTVDNGRGYLITITKSITGRVIMSPSDKLRVRKNAEISTHLTVRDALVYARLKGFFHV